MSPEDRTEPIIGIWYECNDCGRHWYPNDGRRNDCPSCGSTNISECRIRIGAEEIEEINKLARHCCVYAAVKSQAGEQRDVAMVRRAINLRRACDNMITLMRERCGIRDMKNDIYWTINVKGDREDDHG